MHSGIVKKNFVWNFIGVTTNSFISLFLMVIITRINSIDEAGVFTFGFSIACLLFTVGIYAGRTFQVTDNENYTPLEYLFHRGICIGIMLFFSVGWLVFNDYSEKKALIIILVCILKAQEAFYDTVYGVFQNNNHLYKAGYSMFIKSILGVVGFIIIDYITKDLVLSCLGINVVWLSVFIVYDFRNLKKEMYDKKFYALNGIKIFLRGKFAFLFNFLLIYIASAPKYVMDKYLTDELQAIFGIILMPATLISLCGQYLLNPFLNEMKAKYRQKEKKAFRKIVRNMNLALYAVGGGALLAMGLIGIDIMELIYGVPLKSYSENIYIIIVGGILYASTMVLSTALTTMRRTFNQFLINLCVSIIALIGSHIFMRLYSIDGASIIYFIIMIIQYGGYWLVYRFNFKKEFI